MPTKTTKPGFGTFKMEVRYVPAAMIGSMFGSLLSENFDALLKPAEMDLMDTPTMAVSRRAINHPKSLETIYTSYQSPTGDKNERTAQLHIRAMAPGDAIVIDKTPYYATHDGFVVKRDGEWVKVSEESVADWFPAAS